MTATEILRRMLDERGGFRVDFDREGARRTCWKNDDEQDGYCYFDEDAFGATQLTVTRITPEQAIAATLGTGTCHITDNGPWGYPYVCSACGASFAPDVNNGEFNYCPNCGKRVVEPTTNDVDVEVDA